MKVLITGNDKEVSRIIQENRLRVSRGLVSFESVDECEAVESTSESEAEGQSKRGRKKKEPEIDGKGTVETDTKDVEQ